MHVPGNRGSNKLLAQILSQCKKAGKAAIASYRRFEGVVVLRGWSSGVTN